MENKLSKKEQILDAALGLFAEKGYDGVGVDEIAAKVNMKGPALYYYFKGKDDLLSELVGYLTEYYNRGFARDAALPETLSAFLEMSGKRLAFTLNDERIGNTRRLLVQEQFRNERLSALATFHQLTGVCEMNRKCIEHLQQKGQIKPCDAALAAFEFTAPVSMLIQIADREPARREEIMEQIEKHFAYFKQTHGTEAAE